MDRPSVLFVCLGNICRSPLAEGVMREAAELRGIEVRIDSAGTGDWHVGSEPDRRAQAVAARHGKTPAQIAIAWLLRQDGLVAIPKAVRLEHVRANREALDIELSAEDLAQLDAGFAPPQRRRPLAMR